jgi:hypothetical protein
MHCHLDPDRIDPGFCHSGSAIFPVKNINTMDLAEFASNGALGSQGAKEK